MKLQTIHILPKHISPLGNPIDMCAYMGNCEPGHQLQRDGAYQQGGNQWRTFYNCESRTWKTKRDEGVFEATDTLNIYLDKWHHKKEIQPATLFFDERLMSIRISSIENKT